MRQTSAEVCRAIVGGLRLNNRLRLAEVLHVGVPDQLLGADRGAQAAVVTFGVIDAGKILFHGDGVLGADLLAQAAADAAHGTAAGGDSALGKRCAGDDHVSVRLHGDDQMTGAYAGTGHAVDAQVFVHMGNAVDDLHRAVYTP